MSYPVLAKYISSPTYMQIKVFTYFVFKYFDILDLVLKNQKGDEIILKLGL